MPAAVVARPRVDRVVFAGPLPPKDGHQRAWQGGLVGCGPLSAACLLHGQAHHIAGLALPERDVLAVELLRAQRAFLVPFSGGQRATLPWNYLHGLQTYLRAQGVPLRARGLWGVRRGPALERQLARLFGAGLPVVGLEWSPSQQHYGLLRAYIPGGPLQAELHADGSALHLSPRVGLGGVFWLEPQ